MNKLKEEQAAAPKQQIVEQKVAVEEKVAVAEQQIVQQPVNVAPVELETLQKENIQLTKELQATILDR